MGTLFVTFGLKSVLCIGIRLSIVTVTAASSRLWAISCTRVHWQSLMANHNYFTKLKMMQSNGWNLRRLQHSWNEMKCSNSSFASSKQLVNTCQVLYNLWSNKWHEAQLSVESYTQLPYQLVLIWLEYGMNEWMNHVFISIIKYNITWFNSCPSS